MANRANNIGNFVPTTQVWDVTDIAQVQGASPDLKELLIRLYQNLNRMAISINARQDGTYIQQETVNGSQWFPNPLFNSSTPQSASPRQEFTKVVVIGALPVSAGTKTVPHNIGNPTTGTNTGYTFTFMNGAATDTSDRLYIPIPYASASDDNIELSADYQNVYITVNSDSWASYDNCYVVLKYLKY